MSLVRMPFPKPIFRLGRIWGKAICKELLGTHSYLFSMPRCDLLASIFSKARPYLFSRGLMIPSSSAPAALATSTTNASSSVMGLHFGPAFPDFAWLSLKRCKKHWVLPTLGRLQSSDLRVTCNFSTGLTCLALALLISLWAYYTCITI